MKIQFTKDIISKVLSPALSLWLHSQLERVESLEVKITGNNQQIITGYIPCVYLKSLSTVYQGIHINQVEVKGENIKINLGQVIKGKALRLLEPIIVNGNLILAEEQLNFSLASSLLSKALTDLLFTFLKYESKNTVANSNFNHTRQSWSDSRVEIPSQYDRENCTVNWETAKITSDKLIIQGVVTSRNTGMVSSITLGSGIVLASYRKLLLHPVHIETDTFNLTVDNYEIDLGSQVHLNSLSLTGGKITCFGSATVVSE